MAKLSKLEVRLEDVIKQLIVRRAKESDMSISDYVRHCVLFDSVADGDMEAVKVLSFALKSKISDAFFMCRKKISEGGV